MFKSLFSSIRLQLPVVRADDEIVDHQEILREDCGEKHCSQLQEKYDECNKRVNSRKKTAETCVEELMDFMQCVDHCVAGTLMSKLK